MPDTTEQTKQKPIPVKIPAGLVPRAYVNYDAEVRACLGLPLVLSDGFAIPPLTAGRLMAWEIVSTPFFLHSDTCDPLDAAAAIVLAACEPVEIPELLTENRALAEQRTAEVEASASSLPGLRAYPKLYKAAADWLLAHGAALASDYQRICEWLLVTPATGFLMRNQTEKSAPREWWFDGTFAGGVLAPACRFLGVSFEDILWLTPLCVVGHAVAQHDASVGVKGIERPPDTAVLDRMMEEAEARERRGELHPWQPLDPINYPLTPTQAEANHDLIGQWQDIVEEWHRKHAPAPPEDPAASEASGEEPDQPPDTRESSDAPSAERNAPATAEVEALASCASKAERTAEVQASASCASEAERTAEVQAQPGACPAQVQITITPGTYSLENLYV